MPVAFLVVDQLDCHILKLREHPIPIEPSVLGRMHGTPMFSRKSFIEPPEIVRDSTVSYQQNLLRVAAKRTTGPGP
jgi:hypothetical protein